MPAGSVIAAWCFTVGETRAPRKGLRGIVRGAPRCDGKPKDRADRRAGAARTLMPSPRLCSSQRSKDFWRRDLRDGAVSEVTLNQTYEPLLLRHRDIGSSLSPEFREPFVGDASERRFGRKLRCCSESVAVLTGIDAIRQQSLCIGALGASLSQRHERVLRMRSPQAHQAGPRKALKQLKIKRKVVSWGPERQSTGAHAGTEFAG